MQGTNVEVNAGAIRRDGGAIGIAPAVLGSGLVLLLIFTTSTVFIRSAWPLQSFQIGIYALVGVALLIPAGRIVDSSLFRGVSWLVFLIPLWGIVQIAAHTTASTFQTRGAVLRWGSLAGVFFLTQAVGRTRKARSHLLSAFLWFATAMAVLCLTQLFTSKGRVLWMFPSGYAEICATFQSQNNYVQFIELALPIALWRGLREGWRGWWYPLSGGILYSSVVAAASRAGVVLCTGEVLAILIIGLFRLRDRESGLPAQSTVAVLIAIPVLTVVFTLVAGWQQVWVRLQKDDPYFVRREFAIAAADMLKHKPLTGYGLDTFPEVYQRYAIRDFPFYANHAHNDWAEFAADGGIPFLLLVLFPFAAAVPSAIRNPWGLGLISVILHACVDYPFPRPAVSGWMFLLLGVLYCTRLSEKRENNAAEAGTKEHARERAAASDGN